MNQRHTSVTVSPISCLAYKHGKLDNYQLRLWYAGQGRDGWIEELEFFLTLPAPISRNVPAIQVMLKEITLSQVLSEGRQAHCRVASKK